jgi:secreted trypsin-like serine protease
MNGKLTRILAAAATATAAAAVALAPTGASAITGGRDSTHAYSFNVSLHNKWGFACGGALIAPKWVVTTGDCTSLAPGDRLTKARVGSLHRESGGEVVRVRRYIRHPARQVGGTYANDIGLVELAEPVKATPAKIADAADGTALRILGFGIFDGTSTFSERLREADTKALPVAQSCASLLVDPDPRNDICTPASTSAGACFGDRGSPALLNMNGMWYVAGVFSREGDYDLMCYSGADIYTRVARYRDWIRTYTGVLG